MPERETFPTFPHKRMHWSHSEEGKAIYLSPDCKTLPLLFSEGLCLEKILLYDHTFAGPEVEVALVEVQEAFCLGVSEELHALEVEV